MLYTYVLISILCFVLLYKWGKRISVKATNLSFIEFLFYIFSMIAIAAYHWIVFDKNELLFLSNKFIDTGGSSFIALLFFLVCTIMPIKPVDCWKRRKQNKSVEPDPIETKRDE